MVSKINPLLLGWDIILPAETYMQQQSTIQIAGSLAGKSIVIIRAIFEALILVSFIFIVPMMKYTHGNLLLWKVGRNGDLGKPMAPYMRC